MIPTREQVVSEARSWLATPYHKNGRLKGVGVDCATLLFCIYNICGLIPKGSEGIFNDERIVPIGQDWFCHTTEEKYMRLVLKYAYKVAETICYPCIKASPGNLVLTRAVGSRVYNHGGIVTNWPKIIHAVDPTVREADACTDCLWDHQVVLILDPWLKIEMESK